MSQNHPFSPSPNPSSNIGFQMSNEELLSRRSDWTLACDNALLNRLRDFSENLVTSARELSANCDSLSDDVSNLQFNISNITNEFLMLADTRFVENRVQEFEEFNVVDKKIPKQVVAPSKAEKEAALIEKMKESIQIGVSIQQDRDKLRSVSLEDSTRSTDTGLTSSVNLAHLIGSSKFFSSKYCGLLNENNRVGYSPAASSVPSSSSSLVGASEVNNASDKLIFPNFDEDMMRQINSTSQISSASAGGFDSLENFVPPKAPPFPTEFFNSNVPPIRPPTPHSPTSSTSSSFFESNSGVPSAVANLFNSQSQEQQIISVRPVTITPPDPDIRPPPILDVSDSDDDDIFNSPSAFQQNTSGIQSHFFNQAVPSYAYTQNIFDEPPPEPKPVPGPAPTLTVAATADNAVIGNPAATADVSSISKPKTSKEENFKEVIKSLTKSRDALKSTSKLQVNHNVQLPRKVETEPEPKTVTVPRAEPNKSEPQKPPQTEGNPQFKMPQPPKRTTIFDDSDSDDDLFATMSKPKTQKSISSSLFKSPPSLPSDNQNQTSLNHNQNFKFNNPEQDLRRSSVLDLSENESDDGDDIFKSLSYASKIGQRKNKNDNDSFLNLISPSLPVHEILRDSHSPVDRNPIPVNFESPAAASVVGPSQSQNQFQKNIQNETEHLEIETATSKSDSQSMTYSHASLESDIIPINVNDTPSPTPSDHSEFQSQHHNSKINSTENEKQIKSDQAKSEDTPTRTNHIHDGSDDPNPPVSSAVEDDFFDTEPAPVRASVESTSTKTTSGIPKVVTVTNNDTQSFGSTWLPPVPACPPSPTISTDEEDDFDIFKSHQSRNKTVVTDSQNKIHPQTKVPTAKHNPTPGPVQLNAEPPEVPISSRLPESATTLAPVAAPVVKPKFKSQNVDRLKSKSIFDSSDSDDDLFSIKSKSIKSSPSVKDASPQPAQPSNISYFKDERYVEPQVQAPTIKPLHASLNVNEPPPFISKSLSSNNLQNEKDEHNAILNRAPRILDLSDEDSDDDLFTSMAKTQNQSRQRQQQEIKVIDSAPITRTNSSSFASSLYVSAPADFSTQVSAVPSASKVFAEATVSKEHAEDPVSNSILADTLNSPTTVPAPSVSDLQQQNKHDKQSNFYSNSNAKISSESTIPLPRNKGKAESKTILKEKSIFESSESDDDLFSTAVKTPTIPKSMPYSISSPFLKSNSKSPVITRSASITDANSTFGTSKSKSKTLSLFDDSDDDDSSDLFKGSSSSQIKTKDKVITSPVPQHDQARPETEANGKEKNSAVLESNETVSQSDEKRQYDKDVMTSNSIVENTLKSKSTSSGSVTETQTHGVEGNNPRDNIFGAVAKSLENIFSANKNNMRIVSSTATLSSNFLDSISFDQEASTENLLHCVTKSRPKILHQRRPPSLKRRQYSKSTSSLHNITANVDTNELDPLV